jgi:hypothetical protein
VNRRVSPTRPLLRSDLAEEWRRERDSNPRYPFGYSGFQDRPFQPLTHPSVCGYSVEVIVIADGAGFHPRGTIVVEVEK